MTDVLSISKPRNSFPIFYVAQMKILPIIKPQPDLYFLWLLKQLSECHQLTTYNHILLLPRASSMQKFQASEDGRGTSRIQYHNS